MVEHATEIRAILDEDQVRVFNSNHALWLKSIGMSTEKESVMKALGEPARSLDWWTRLFGVDDAAQDGHLRRATERCV